MRPIAIFMLTFMTLFISSASFCSKKKENIDADNNTPMANSTINITVNTQVFTATLLDNNTAKAFAEMLPLTMNMTELNGNEKYCGLPNSLPVNSSNPGMIKNGDLMLYGSQTLVLFYKTFSTAYSYTKLGSVDDPTGLATALGSGNVTVKFEHQMK